MTNREIAGMPFSLMMSRFEEQQRYEAHQLADLIVGVNQGTNGDPAKVNLMLKKLRDA